MSSPTVTVQKSWGGWRVVVRRGVGTHRFECMTRAGVVWRVWKETR